MTKPVHTFRSEHQPANNADKVWSGRVLLWEDHGIFVGRSGDADLHESPAIKICISHDGPLGLPSGPTTASIIPAGVSHWIKGGAELSMVLIAPEGSLGQKLLAYSQDAAIVSLDEHHTQLLKCISAVGGDTPETEANSQISKLVDLIASFRPSDIPAKVDPRIERSIEWIKQGRENGFLVKDIAAEVELSESRFSHLFTEFVRVPVRRYSLWLRLRDALHFLASAETLTEAAHFAGFADSAHLSRTFRSALGIAPSDLVRTSKVTSFLP